MYFDGDIRYALVTETYCYYSDHIGVTDAVLLILIHRSVKVAEKMINEE